MADQSTRAGTITLVLGLLFAAAVAWTYALSLSESFDPPTWVRILGLVWLPIGFVGVPVGHLVARYGEGRLRSRIGLQLALMALAALVVLLFARG